MTDIILTSKQAIRASENFLNKLKRMDAAANVPFRTAAGMLQAAFAEIKAPAGTTTANVSGDPLTHDQAVRATELFVDGMKSRSAPGNGKVPLL